MTLRDFHVDDDIRRAETLPADVYHAPEHYRAQLDRTSWHLLPDASGLKAPGHVRPFTLLPGSLDPAFPFEGWIEPVRERMYFLAMDEAWFDPETSKDYYTDANWALYVDNFLEGFHISYVHARSLSGLDYDDYRTERFAWCNLQLAPGGDDAPAFELPDDHPEAGGRISACYFWLFPNLMLNFYPWGLSMNVVYPLGPHRTKIAFRTWMLDDRMPETGIGAHLHRVEMEDEEVVASVQRGVRSRLYDRGRYSPAREVGRHHFHTLLDRFLTAS